MQNKQIKCPQCGRFAFYSPENPFRPFCSERCKLIDLGQWASGSYSIPAENNTPSEPNQALGETGEDDDSEFNS
ncbi:DNA gyrase inhibitor YacG [Pseudobdellovibrio exovorus]|uniref:Uncharacterized protein n=1 Tax=Pseudobdellovibrio exovorus JSS TaxID=1184267 RepID=M4VE66_9BACT|nr:DNA gyrase inhibitor YacG [Pseudobdellovibrio exovorus]AGH96336.1 hypothetical protein A11Q_2120 [Pseudobdellovibrio exovorus JSS]